MIFCLKLIIIKERKMQKIIVGLILVLTLGEISGQNHGINGNWYQSPKSVPPTVAGAKMGGAVANSMVVTRDGAVIIFYKENGKIFMAGSSDNGNSWLAPAPRQISVTAGMLQTGTASAESDTSGNIHIVWKASEPLGLFHSIYYPLTQNWSEVTSINTQITSSIGFYQITVDRKNRLHVMWQDGNHESANDTAEVYYSCSIDGGLNWSTRLRLSSFDGKPDAFPVADFSGTESDTLLIPWRENSKSASGWDVYGARSTNGGANWQTQQLLAGGQGNQWDPNLVIDKYGRMHLFFHVYPNPNPAYTASVLYIYSLDGGNTWSEQRTISQPLIRSHLVKTAYDFTNNRVWCFWKDERDFNFSTGNPEADIIGLYTQLAGENLYLSEPEFISDGDSTEYGYHNFKAGDDGIMRAHFFLMVNGEGDSLYYTQRSTVSSAKEADGLSNRFFLLLNNYPNPFNPETTIEYYIPEREIVTIQIYNSLGQKVRNLLQEEKPAGSHKIRFNAEALASGVYYARISAGKHFGFVKMLLLR